MMEEDLSALSHRNANRPFGAWLEMQRSGASGEKLETLGPFEGDGDNGGEGAVVAKRND